jgi:peptidoglycan/LPS O-acetylase OafA/YrhL
VVVFFYHYFLSFYPALFVLRPDFAHTSSNIEAFIGQSPLAILYSGGFAVCVFFVLSGYVLSYKFFLQHDYLYLASSAIKRYFRLAIPILASVLLSYIILLAGAYMNAEIANKYTRSTFWFSSLWNMSPDILEALKEGTYTALFKGGTLNYNSVLWTMNLEFIYSLLVFATLALFGTLRKRWIIYSILILCFWSGFMPAFVLGMALCDYYTSAARKPIKLPLLILFAVLFIYFGSYQKVDGNSIWSPINFLSKANNAFPFLVGAVSLLIIVINSGRLQKILSHKWIQFLGRISFSLYLLHLIILGSFSCFLFKVLFTNTQMDYNACFLITFIVSLWLALFLSQLMYRFVDSNATRFAGNFYKWLFKP